MSAPSADELPPLPEHQGDWLDAVHAHDGLRQQFLESCTEFYQDPSEATIDDMGLSGQKTAEALDRLMVVVLVHSTDVPVRARLNAARQLLVNEGKLRVEHLGKTTQSGEFAIGVTKQKAAVEKLTAAIESATFSMIDEESVEGIMGTYLEWLFDDIKHLKVLAVERSLSRTERIKSLLSSGNITKHLLNAAAISAGAVIGNWVLNRQHRD